VEQPVMMPLDLSNGKSNKTRAELDLIQGFQALESDLPGCDRMRQMRAEAMSSVARAGLPSRRVEEWRYTDLRSQWEKVNPVDPVPPYDPREIYDDCDLMSKPLKALQLRLVNGHLASEARDLILPEGVRLRSLTEVLESGEREILDLLKRHDFMAEDASFDLNLAFVTGGIVLQVPDGVQMDQVVTLVHSTHGEARMTATRSIILLGKGASLGLVEVVNVANTGHQTNDILQVILSDGAKLSHLRHTLEDKSSLTLSSMLASVGDRGKLESFVFSTPDGFSRRQALVDLYEDSEVRLAGLDLLKGDAHSDTTAIVRHNSEQSSSQEGFRSILDGQAKRIFQGKVVVRPGSQNTSGTMFSNGLLLSGAASMVNKPELEIFANSVCCSHGATCGALDEVALFYMMSRGIPRSQAESLLIKAFALEIIEDIDEQGLLKTCLEVLRQDITLKVGDWTKARGS